MGIINRKVGINDLEDNHFKNHDRNGYITIKQLKKGQKYECTKW